MSSCVRYGCEIRHVRRHRYGSDDNFECVIPKLLRLYFFFFFAIIRFFFFVIRRITPFPAVFHPDHLWKACMKAFDSRILL